MNYINYSNERTRKGELMSKERPLIDYVSRCRKTDQQPERQDGAGAIGWIAVALVCWVVVLFLAGSAGYFN